MTAEEHIIHDAHAALDEAGAPPCDTLAGRIRKQHRRLNEAFANYQTCEHRKATRRYPFTAAPRPHNLEG